MDCSSITLADWPVFHRWINEQMCDEYVDQCLDRCLD